MVRMRSGRGASLETPTIGHRDRYTLMILHEGVRMIEQRAFAREHERDDAAQDARARHGNEAVTCGFVRDFKGRAHTRVWL